MLFEPGASIARSWTTSCRRAKLFARVLDLDPDTSRRAAAGGDLFPAREVRGARADPHMLTRKADKKDNKELNQLYYRLGAHRRRTGQRRQGAQVLQARLRPRFDLPTGAARPRGACSTAWKMGRRLQVYKTISCTTATPRRSRRCRHLLSPRHIKLKQGERKKALNMFEKALEIEADPSPDAAGVIELQQQANDWKRSSRQAQCCHRRGAGTVKLLDEIGDTYHKPAQQRQKADHGLLERSRWRPAITYPPHCSISTRRPSSGRRRSRSSTRCPTREGSDSPRQVLHAAARILRDEVQSLDEAIDMFNQALDHTSRFGKDHRRQLRRVPEAFGAIRQDRTGKKDFKRKSATTARC